MQSSLRGLPISTSGAVSRIIEQHPEISSCLQDLPMPSVRDSLNIDSRPNQLAAKGLADLLNADQTFGTLLSRFHRSQMERYYQPLVECLGADDFQSLGIDYAVYEEVVILTSAIKSAGALVAATNLGVPFYSNHLEAPICIYDQLEREGQGLGRPPASVGQLVTDILKNAWSTSATTANELRRRNFLARH